MLTQNTQLQPDRITEHSAPETMKPAKTFRYDIDVFLKDSNATGNTYFSRYFDWQGICREQWFYQSAPFELLQSLGVFITKSAHQDYVQETFPFQKVECRLNTFNVKQCSFSMIFRFYVEGKLVSRGYQRILFASHDRKILRIPKHILAEIREYEDPDVSLADLTHERSH